MIGDIQKQPITSAFLISLCSIYLCSISSPCIIPVQLELISNATFTFFIFSPYNPTNFRALEGDTYSGVSEQNNSISICSKSMLFFFAQLFIAFWDIEIAFFPLRNKISFPSSQMFHQIVGTQPHSYQSVHQFAVINLVIWNIRSCTLHDYILSYSISPLYLSSNMLITTLFYLFIFHFFSYAIFLHYIIFLS